MLFDETMSYEEARGIISKTNLLNILCKKILTLEPILHSNLSDTFGRFITRIILLLDEE